MSTQSKGGRARARSLSASRRSEIAAVAARARWGVGCGVQGVTIACASGKSPACLRQIIVAVASEDKASRVIRKLNWIVLHDHEKVYGHMCPCCVKAHGSPVQTS